NNQWNALKGQEISLRQNLVHLEKELPADRQAVRQQHVRLETEEQVLDRSLTALRAQAGDVQKELDRLAHQRDQAQKLLADLQGRLSTAEAGLRHGRQALERALKELPARWQTQAEHAGLKELSSWRQERDDLVQKAT